jgi:hypothetical protein
LAESTLQEVSAFAELLGLEPLLAPEAQGDTHLAAADRLDIVRRADYAVFLSTADQLDAMSLEFGVMLGAIGRGRISIVVMGQNAPAAQWEGVPRVTMDEAGVWRLLLAREMRQAGLDVDLNRAL